MSNLRNFVGVVTDRVFPPPKYRPPDTQQQYLKKPAQDYVSSLPLQMLLYFDVFFFPMWLITEVVLLAAKFGALNGDLFVYKIVLPAILASALIVEVIRLYIAYVGNLMEKVPELAGFWLLTLLIEFPLLLFLLLNIQTIITPIEYAVNILMTLFLVLEIIVGYFAIRAMVNYQVTKFHVQQFTDLRKEGGTDDTAMLLEPYSRGEGGGGYYNEALSHRD